jgi:hypothetical protein
MAHKRKVVVDRVAEPIPDLTDDPEELGWKDWLLHRYARLWYWVTMLFVDVIVFLEIQRSLDTNALVAGMAVVAVAMVQLFIYLRIWGRGGRLGNEYEED